MTWHAAWLVLTGLMFAGYLLTEGRSIGIGLILPVLGRSDRDRDAVVDTIGPYFLGNEVWIVSVVGLLIGGFPVFEGTLLSGLFPLFAAFALGMVVRGASFHFRRRHPSPRWRRGWAAAITAASLVIALALGAIAAALLHALPLRPDGVLPLTAGVLFTPFGLACALTSVLFFALRGAAFAATRTRGPLAGRAIGLASLLTRLALAGAAISFGVGLLAADVRASVQQPIVVWVLAGVVAVALVVCDVFAMRAAPRRALALSGVVLLAAAAAVAVGRLPYLLVSQYGDSAGMTVAEGSADPVVLAPLFWVVAVLVPLLAALQWWAGRLYRTARTGARAYF
ncbi:cytochrome d ubiquinol oxidase subunit II [Nonomuraea sp. NBC_00507]|uniref:cytochrome d ubiquinol oxidase subunit II n=1 Tax=Nonomuraea sp. NBC_00507 TaxID=2976002 RepID=UPI002E19EC0C